MVRTDDQLREDALAIWKSGVEAVDSQRLVCEYLQVAGDTLVVGDESLRLSDYRRIVVVGTGKAGTGMAQGVETALGERWLEAKQVTGWVNVPADCVRPLRRIHIHAARPAGVNEPTAAGVEGTTNILNLVRSLTDQDLCLCLISGGGSALLPAPIEGLSLADKQAITKHLSAAGANIQELNTVRKQLSQVKGGNLARACRAGRLITLIISDVLGDPLDVIASGPTVDDTAGPLDALRVLQRFRAREAGISPVVFELLERAAAKTRDRSTVGWHSSAVESGRESQPTDRSPLGARVTNLVIGNNATAVDAAGMEAERRGYSHALVAARQLEGPAEDIGRHHARMAIRMRHEAGPDCLITGGEPTVQLADASVRGKGGRNQQLILSAFQELLLTSAETSLSNPLEGIAVLSGGTDGEDGPTDAAGAWIDSAAFTAWQQEQEQGKWKAPRDVATYLRRNDAYHFFEPLGTLLKTGPTHTNVCDLRVVVTRKAGNS